MRQKRNAKISFASCILLSFAVSMLAACETITPACAPPIAGDIVYVVGQGWHAEIGIPVMELDENMNFYRKVFPGARVLMFGYGKKTFFTAPPDAISEYFIGPFPGTAVIHVVGITVTPPEAYSAENSITLKLPAGGAHALSGFIWNNLSKNEAGKPMEVARSSNPDGLFYAANDEYNLLHTCNTWTADALHATGLPISSDGVIFAGQVMDRVAAVAEYQCTSIR